MDLLKDATVKEYISSLDGISPSYNLLNSCQCLQKNMPEGIHAETTKPYNNNSAELAAMRKCNNIKLVSVFITMKSYFNGDTMKMLMNKMLKCKDTDTVEDFYYVLYSNFLMHPPCAQYMNLEYENLLLTPYKNYFMGMTLWDYLIDCLNLITSRSFPNQDNKVAIYSIKKSFIFCVDILQMDFEVSKKKNCNPLVMKCLKYDPEKKPRMHKFTNFLNKLFKDMKDFEIPVIHLAMLVNQLKVY